MRHTRMLGWTGALFLLLAVVPWARAGWAGAAPACFRGCCPPGSRQVTSFHHSFFRDPCTGQAGVVVQRVTACRPKHCGPVRRFLRRLFGKPDCCDPCPPVAVPVCAPAPPPAAVIQPPPMDPPGVAAPPPGLAPPPAPPPVPPPGETSPLRLRRTPPPLTAPTPPRPIPFDRLASRAADQGTLVGRVAPGAEVLLIPAGADGGRRSSRADGSGRFRADLPGGGWLIYVREAEGRATFAGRAEVRAGAVSEAALSGR